MNKMKKVCAWCSKELDPGEEMTRRGPVTHGICSLCALKMTQNVQRSARQILDFLEVPVLVVDGEGVVMDVNSSARKVLELDEEQKGKELLGDVIECKHSKSDQGCGRTIHCTTCTIRNILTDTLVTGKGYEKIPAFQIVKTPQGEQKRKILLSTERVNDRILLRIDEIVDL